MSITLEFYSALPATFLQQIEKWFHAETDEETDLRLDELYALYPRADFSFHLHWPTDIDALCQAFISVGLDVPGTCASLIIKDLWSDGESVWIDLISQDFPSAIAHISDDTIKHILEHWIKHLAPSGPVGSIQYTHVYNNALKAILDLRMVSQDILKYNKNMLLFRVW